MFFDITIYNIACCGLYKSVCLCWFIPSQDAHELFHVLTSSLEEERDRQPKVAPLFDMQSLEASYDPSLLALSLKLHINISGVQTPPVCSAVQFSSLEHVTSGGKFSHHSDPNSSSYRL